jgi:hypothetical protein
MSEKTKLLPWQFKLSECEAQITLIENQEGYGTAFLNIKFPDGRWITFKSVEGVKMYESKVVQVSSKAEAKTE